MIPSEKLSKLQSRQTSLNILMTIEEREYGYYLHFWNSEIRWTPTYTFADYIEAEIRIADILHKGITEESPDYIVVYLGTLFDFIKDCAEVQ